MDIKSIPLGNIYYALYNRGNIERSNKRFQSNKPSNKSSKITIQVF